MIDRLAAILEAESEITDAEIEAGRKEFAAARIDEDTFLLEVEPGRTEALHFEGDIVRVVEKLDTTAHQDYCKACFNESVNHKSEFRRIASFPPEALRLWGWLNCGLTDPIWYLKREFLPLLVRAAHDRDMSQFRTMPGNYIRRGRA